MKLKNHIILAKFAAVSIVLLSVGAAKSLSEAASPQIQSQTLWAAERNQLQQLQQEKEIRDRVQAEVDRAFSRATTLINILLFVMTLFPVVIALGVWLLRRSVINQLVSEIKKELQTEVENQLEAEVAQEFKYQTATFKQETERLLAEFVTHLSQLQALFIEAQKEKDKIIQEISNIMPSSLQAPISPELQSKIVQLTNQLEALTSENSQLFFSADDYVKQGDALFFENRYQEAIDCYDKALKITPDNGDVWFFKGYVLQKLGRYDEAIACYDKTIEIYPDDMDYWYYKACCYALQGNAERAVETLQQAIYLNPRCIKWAESNSDFDAIRQDERFQQLINNSTASDEPQHTLTPPTKVEVTAESQTLNKMPSPVSNIQPDSVQTEELITVAQPLTIDDYLQQGNAYFSQGRYAEANETYNEALKIERDLPEVRYQNAKAYALRGSINPAIGNLQWAIDIDPKYKEMAKTDSAFDEIRTNEQFKKLIDE